MKPIYLLHASTSDIISGKDKHGKTLTEIVTEANHEVDTGRLLSPDVLITNMATGEGRRFLSLADASRFLGHHHNYLSVMFSNAKKEAHGKLVQSIVKADFYITRLDWVNRNLMVN